MIMNENIGDTPPAPDSVWMVLGFQGVLGKGKYFLGLCGALLIVVVAFGFFATAMNPTGGGAPLLGFPILLIYVYIHAAIVAARLRDSGRSPWLTILFLIAPFVWFGAVIEFTEASEAAWFVAIAGFLAIYIAPGLMRRKDEVETTA
jgi:uncharacterized membrane protein YhaH (DUF805 family)